jgi:Phospholipase_D-nuclease N-terminal
MFLFADGALALLFLGLWIFCIIDVITTPDGAQRNLPKLVWLIIVIILPDVGSIAWLIAGHPWQGQGANLPYKGNTGNVGVRRAPPGRSVPSRPDDDQDFLDGLRARAEEQRRRAREAQPPEDEKGTP